MTSQDLYNPNFGAAAQQASSQSLTLSQLENMSDSEKLFSDGAEDFLQENLREGGVGLSQISSFSFGSLNDQLSGNMYEPADLLNSQPIAVQVEPLAFQTVGSSSASGTYPLVAEALTQVLPVNHLFPIPPGMKFEILTQVDAGGGENQSLSQSSTTSLDSDGVPSMEPWAGNYNFSIAFQKEVFSRKFSFSEKNRKLFCVPHEDIEILFSYDFSKCKASDMSLNAFMRYTKSDAAMLPVLRCAVQHQLPGQSGLPQSDPATVAKLADHVLQCSHTRAEYSQDGNGRCSVKVPLGRPQGGVQTIARCYKFVCLNSCKPPPAFKKLPVAVVFELLEKNKVVGRASFNVRVCSCPSRDFFKEEEGDAASVGTPGRKRKPANCSRRPTADTPTTGDSKRSRKRDSEATLEEDLERTAKSRRISEPGHSSTIAQAEEKRVELPEVELDPLMPSSQESLTSEEEYKIVIPQKKREKMREAYDMAKWILKLQFATHPVLKTMGKAFMSHTRNQVNVASALLRDKRDNAEGGNTAAGSVATTTPKSKEMISNGSPDSGVGQ